MASMNDANFALAAVWITCFPERLFQILFTISGPFIWERNTRPLTRQVISGTLLSTSVMHIAELIIIYLAYGAPFGVYDLSCSRKKPTAGELHLILVKFVFWPLLVASWMRRWFFRGRRGELRHRENELYHLRENFEKMAFSDRSAAAILQFREVYARYTGLTMFLLSRTDPQDRHPLSEFRHDPETKAAAACLYRRDRQKVVIHRRQARIEFLTIIRQLSSGLTSKDELILGSIEIAVILEDPECANGLYSLLPGDRVNAIRAPLRFPKVVN